MAEKLAEQLVNYVGRNDRDAMNSLKRSLETLRCQAKDIEDEVEIEEMSCKKKIKTEIENWLNMVNGLTPECDKLEATVRSSRFPLIGDPVGKMQCRVNQLIEQRNHFKEPVLDDFDNNGEPCLSTKLFGNKIMETYKRIWRCLVFDNISSIGIYGMGGVGKTTLAKHIEFELKQSNYHVYWVTVSQQFSIRNLQDKIANVLHIPLSNQDEEHKRADILRAKFIKLEKSVLILDDFWEEFLLEDVGIAIGADKCRLIWTTRSSQVCHRMRCQRKFEVKTLDEKESRDLFKHTLGSETVLSEEVESIAESVADRCAGLPLGIVTTAASMRGVTDMREWKAALVRLNSCCDEYHEMEDKVFPILEYSFNHLRGYEIPCFLYCSLYPEDHEIEREKLIDLFDLVGLIPRRGTMELARNEGHAILNKLVRMCLLEEIENGIDEVVYVRMHDLIRDMALRITSGKYISKIIKDVPRFLVKSKIDKSNGPLVEKEELKDDLDAVSLMRDSYYFIGPTIEFPALVSSNCSNLSTLIINHVRIIEIPDSFLQHMHGLKVLNLEGCKDLRALPSCVSDLGKLTALLLKNCCSLESVPPLGKLKRLRTLNLLDTRIGDVPQGLEELVNLERLYFCGKPGLAYPEGTFSKLHRLQHLVLMDVIVHINDIVVLKQLELFIGDLTGWCAYNQFSKSWRWPTVCVIRIWDEFSDIQKGSENKFKFQVRNFKKGVDVVLPPVYLRNLCIQKCSGFSGIFFHRWIDRSKDLCNLELCGLEELKFVLNFSSPVDDEGGVTSNLVGGLLNVPVLKLEYLPNLVELINWRSPKSILPGTFSSLKELHVIRCYRLKTLFSVQLLKQSLQNLKCLSVQCCTEIEEIVGNNDEEEAMEFQACSSGCMPSTAHFLLLPKLQRLTLRFLAKLESVCSPTITIGADQPTTFRLDYCSKLKRLPSFSSARITYEITGCNEWWNSLDWENTSDKDAVQPFFEVQ